jgi:hypothetical protein
MAAKYGTTGRSSAPDPTAQPAALVQQPAIQQPMATGQGIIGLLKNRGAQIDRAVNGYSRGGLVAYARGGKIQGPGTSTSDSIPAEVAETGEPIRVANQERILSKAQDDFLASIAKREGFTSVDAFLEAGTGKPVGPTIKGGRIAAADGKPPWYQQDPLTALTAGSRENASNSASAEDSLKSLYPVGTFDDKQPQATSRPTGIAAYALPARNWQDDYIAKGPSATNDVPVPDNSAGAFFKGGKAFNVNPSSQNGISKVTAKGTSPLYTNIKPEDAVSGLNNQTVGDPQEGLARYARANAITQSLIDKQPQGGVGVLNDPNDAANAEKTARWRVDDLIYGSRNNPASARAIDGTLHNQGQAEAGQLAQQTAASGLVAAALRDDKNNGVATRGQDMNLKGEELRAAGNPMDNKVKQASLDQQKQVSDLQAKYLAATDPKEKAAYAEQIRGLSGKSGEDDVVVVPGGEYTDPDNSMVKLKGKPTIYNKRTGQFTSPPVQVMTQQPDSKYKVGEVHVDANGSKAIYQQDGSWKELQAPPAAIDMLKKNPEMASVFDAKYGQGASKKHLGN